MSTEPAEAAKADGRWAAAYESQRNATVPPDLAAALAASPRAARAFDALSRTQRYAMILKVVTARTAAARGAQLPRAMTELEARLVNRTGSWAAPVPITDSITARPYGPPRGVADSFKTVGGSVG